MKTNWLDYTLLTLVIIGAINWGLIGFFRFDLVAFPNRNATRSKRKNPISPQLMAPMITNVSKV